MMNAHSNFFRVLLPFPPVPFPRKKTDKNCFTLMTLHCYVLQTIQNSITHATTVTVSKYTVRDIKVLTVSQYTVRDTSLTTKY